MGGRAGARATAARRAAQDRMRRAAERLRTGDELGDKASAREATARLLEHLADQDLNIHTFDRAANLADRILAGDPYRAMDDGFALPEGYNNGTDRVR